MSKRLQIAVMLGGVFLLGTAAQAGTVTKTYVGPNGGTVHYRGDTAPGHYRGAVTVTTPEGETYRRVTKAHRGPNGVAVSRRWVGPNGAAAARATVGY
jgi:hypothetical protein